MKINYLAIILLVSVGAVIHVAGFDSYNWLPVSLESALGQLCQATNNVVINELMLINLGRPYGSLLVSAMSEKDRLLTQFRAKYCNGRSVTLNPASRYELYKNRLDDLLAFLSSLVAVSSDRNLTAVEYVLNCFGIPYSSLIGSDFSAKLSLLNSLLSPSSTSSALPVVSPVRFVAPIPSVPVARGGAGGPVPVAAFMPNLKTECNQYLPELGAGDGFCLLASNDVNVVNLLEFPVIGKYGDPYNMASAAVVIKNNLLMGFEDVPVNIKALIADGYAVDFYTEILYWPHSADYGSFHGKHNIFNIVFHGTMMDWFADKYATFNFAANSESEIFKMGIAAFNGVIPVDLGNLDAGEGLKSLSVNPHNNRYSPDDAQLRVLPGRNLVTFWSVAKSDEKRKTIVTYHVLLDQASHPNLVNGINRISGGSNTIAELIVGLSALPNIGGADGAAWQGAIDFLRRLYSVR